MFGFRFEQLVGREHRVQGKSNASTMLTSTTTTTVNNKNNNKRGRFDACERTDSRACTHTHTN